MGIQHHDRFLRILTGHTRIKVIHRVIFQLQSFTVLCNRADYILLKSARSKRITDLPKHFYIHTDSSCIFILILTFSIGRLQRLVFSGSRLFFLYLRWSNTSNFFKRV